MSKLYKRGETYYVRYKANGKLVWKSLRTKNRREAEQRRKTFQALTETPSILDDQSAPSIQELVSAYLEHADSYYVRADGTPTQSIHKIRSTLDMLCDLHGDTPTTDFGPRKLKQVRNEWVARGLARRTVNNYTDELRRMFKWAVSEELIPVTVYQALITVPSLRAGERGVAETKPVKPPPTKAVNAVRKIVPPQICALIDLQLATAARPGELCGLRPCDIDTSEDLWFADLHHHKTKHHGHDRIIYFGPRAQRVLEPFLNGRKKTAPLFSPQEAEAHRYAQRPTHRRAGQRPNPRKTRRGLGDHYTAHAYTKAIARACKHANVDHWSPNQLRHAAATKVRKKHGIEAAQVILGHSSITPTEIYAEKNQALAMRIALESG